MPGAYPRPELLATPDWLAENLGRPELRILDVRWRPDGTGGEVFARGHVPGAVHVDWRSAFVDTQSAGDVLLLAPPDHVAAALGSVGIGNGSTVVVYDDTASLYASRTWWSLRAYGLESVRILDGGYPAWLASGRPTGRAASRLEAVTFLPRMQTKVRLTTSDVQALLGSPDALILDARAPTEYRGFEGNARRLGHIPGATSVPVTLTSEPGTGRFADGDSLRSLLARAGITRSRRIICYDGSGVAAAKLAFVLSLMGYEDVAVYDGGWADWGARLDLPVDR